MIVAYHIIFRTYGFWLPNDPRGRFWTYVQRTKLPIWACAILPDHVHLVTGRPAMKVEQLVIQLKGNAMQQLEREGIHSLARFRSATGR